MGKSKKPSKQYNSQQIKLASNDNFIQNKPKNLENASLLVDVNPTNEIDEKPIISQLLTVENTQKLFNVIVGVISIQDCVQNPTLGKSLSLSLNVLQLFLNAESNRDLLKLGLLGNVGRAIRMGFSFWEQPKNAGIIAAKFLTHHMNSAQNAEYLHDTIEPMPTPKMKK